MQIGQLVDLQAIEALLAHGTNPKKRQSTRALIPDEMPLEQALRGVTEEYAGIPNEEMAKHLYERLVPVHYIETGLVPIIYAFNIRYHGSNQLIDDWMSFYRSSDIITMQSCSGHLENEQSTGRTVPWAKAPFIAFDHDRPELQRFQSYAAQVEDYPFPMIMMRVNCVPDADSFVHQLREFWHNVIDDLNAYTPINIKHDLVDEIRP
ncbi:MAG: hypothetical protein KJ601_08110 [Nanoarchaeota archaeon]|nr:hypothetical protein [Nanoarchaeota archaeon]